MHSPPLSNIPGEAEPIRLLLLDEQALFRETLARLLGSTPGFEVAAEHATGHEALESLNRYSVDLVILEFDLSDQNSTEFITAARSAGYVGKFLIVTGAVDAKRSAAALKSGAAGIFLKSKSLDLLVHSIKLVLNGEIWVDQMIIQLLLDGYSRTRQATLSGPLTDRQKSVLLRVLEGLTTKQIGRALGMSEGTVKGILRQLFYRAGVRTRTQLVRATLEGSAGLTVSEAEGTCRPAECVSHSDCAE